MNDANENQHFVSQVLLRRFAVSGRLQCYNLKSGTWKLKSPKRVFSARGWNQLLVNGQADNSLEARFSAVETHLPQTFRALEEASCRPLTELPLPIYENLCQYCTFLWLTSPFAKAKAPVDLALQLDWELTEGKDSLLRDLGCSEMTIRNCQQAHGRGGKIIFDLASNMQLIYRFQFRQLFPATYSKFFGASKWMIWNSPIEFPISDIALVQLSFKDEGAVVYVLPIGPNFLLTAKVNCGQQNNSFQRQLKGGTFTANEASYWLDAICLSAVSELVSRQVISDIRAIRSRAKTIGTSFPQIVDPDRLILAGLTEPAPLTALRVVSTSEWVKFIHSFLLPPTPCEGAKGIGNGKLNRRDSWG